MHADAKLLFMKTDCPSLERIDGDRRLVKLVLHDKNSGDSVDQTSPVWFLGIHPTGAQEIDHPWMLPPVGSREGCKNMVRFANQKPSHRTTQPLLPRLLPTDNAWPGIVEIIPHDWRRGRWHNR